MENNTNITNEGGSPVKYIHLGIIFRRVILIFQYLLGAVVIITGVLLWIDYLDFKFISNFFALLSLLTGCIIFTSCTAEEINDLKKLLRIIGITGGLAGIAGALVFWQILPSGAWYYLNLLIVIGICFSIFSETEKGRKIRSVIHVVTSIIILLTSLLTVIHTLGAADLQLPLFILYGATFLLVCIVIYRNYKNHNL